MSDLEDTIIGILTKHDCITVEELFYRIGGFYPELGYAEVKKRFMILVLNRKICWNAKRTVSLTPIERK